MALPIEFVRAREGIADGDFSEAEAASKREAGGRGLVVSGAAC